MRSIPSLPLVVGLSLAACAPQPPLQPLPPALVQGAQIDAVLARVKQEVGLFLYDSVQVDQKWPALLTDLGQNGNPLKPVCGTGHIEFNITNIKMDFAAEADFTGGANAGLTIPVLPAAAAASLSPSATFSSEKNSTENIGYSYYPPTTATYANTLANLVKKGISPDQFSDINSTASIRPALDAMRDGLIKATTRYPCFLNASPTSPDNTLVFTVALIQDAKAAGGFKFLILSVGASAENKTTGTNTITVSFHPVNPGEPTAPAKPKT